MSDHEALVNLIHREILRVQHRSTRRTPGVVDSYDKETHSVKVKLMPDSIDDGQPVVTGWLPLHPLQTGNKAGWHSPPNIKDHGWIEFHDDDREAGHFQVATFNDKFPPDKTVEAGELKYIHPGTQTQIYFDKNGNITIRGQNTSNANGGNNNNGAGGGTNQDNSKQTIVLKSDGSITIQDKSGNGKIVLDGNGNMTFTCVKYTINATGEIDLNCSKVVINGGSSPVETIDSALGSNDLLVRPNGAADPSDI
jgi:hypothetical protein